MLLLVPAAYAHPAVLPHAHDPAALAIVAFWAVAGLVFLAAVLRRRAAAAA